MRLRGITGKTLAWLIVSFAATSSSSCHKEVKLLPSDDRVFPGDEFCASGLTKEYYVCYSKAMFVDEQSLLIQCREVLAK